MHFITAEEHGKISLVKDRSVCLHGGKGWGGCWRERQKQKDREVNRERLGELGGEEVENVEGELIRSTVCWGWRGGGVDSLRLW